MGICRGEGLLNNLFLKCVFRIAYSAMSIFLRNTQYKIRFRHGGKYSTP